MDVPLQDYIERVVAEQWKGHEETHKALALALTKQDETITARLAGMNEWRATVGDLSAKYITRETFDARIQLLQTEHKRDRQVLTNQMISLTGVAIAAAVFLAHLLGI